VITIVVVAYAVVPEVADFMRGADTYNPGGYDPRDFARRTWLAERAQAGVPTGESPWRSAVNIALFLVVVAAWFAVIVQRRSRGR
jgi:hypothetical protein